MNKDKEKKLVEFLETIILPATFILCILILLTPMILILTGVVK